MSPRGGRRKGAGRKPKPSAERRDHTVTVSLTQAEAKQLRELAGDESVSGYVYRLVGRHLKRKSP